MVRHYRNTRKANNKQKLECLHGLSYRTKLGVGLLNEFASWPGFLYQFNY
jgi:hypothetical protein